MSKAKVAMTVGFVVLLVGATWVVASRQQTPEQAALNAKPPVDKPVLAVVERRRLEKPVVFRCTGRSQFQVPVDTPALPGGYLALVTRVGVGSGGEVTEGMVVVEVSHRPVIVLKGTVQAYRSLEPDDTGKDIIQLQRALRSLGLRPETDGRYGPRTEIAVRRLYEVRGYSPIYQDPAAQRRPIVPLGEIAFVPQFPAHAKILVSMSQRVEEGTLGEIFAGEITIRGTVAASDGAALRPGISVSIFDDLEGTSFEGRVRSIGPPAQLESGQGRVVTIAPLKPLPVTTSAADLRCSAVLARTEESALVVPITAVLSDPSGKTYVLVVTPDGRERRVDVTLGLSATTHVEIRPDRPSEIDAGNQVVVGNGD